MSKTTRRNADIAFLSRLNIDTFENLRRWSDSRLEQSVSFAKAELQKAKLG